MSTSLSSDERAEKVVRNTKEKKKGEPKMNESWKKILLVLAIVYFVSPVDLAPGLLMDDFIALAVALGPFFAAKSEA